MEEFIKNTVAEAGKILLEKFGKVGVKNTKAHAMDVVTEADNAANDFIISAIKETYPDHGVISEETGEYNSDAEYVWVIDPLDGTLNYSRSIPFFVSQIALLHNNEVELAAICYPVLNQLYFAKKGSGAYLNDEKIHCSTKTDIVSTLGAGMGRLEAKRISQMEKLISDNEADYIFLRSLGSVGLTSCYVACGQIDWSISQDGCIWDYAPVYLILAESGCMVTNFKGKKFGIKDKQILAANPLLHQNIIKLLNT